MLGCFFFFFYLLFFFFFLLLDKKNTSFLARKLYGQDILTEQRLRITRAPSEPMMADSVAQNIYNWDIEENRNYSYDNFIEYSSASTPDAQESDISRLRNELTEKILLLETRSHAMSSEAQLRTELARKNAELAQSNSEIRRLKSTQGRDRYAAPSSLEVKTLNPIEEDAKELRKRVKVAWKQISAMQNSSSSMTKKSPNMIIAKN